MREEAFGAEGGGFSEGLEYQAGSCRGVVAERKEGILRGYFRAAGEEDRKGEEPENIGFKRDSRYLLLKRSIFRYLHCGFPISFYRYTFLFCFC